MGDPKAFLNIPRQEAGYRPIHERITDFSQVEQTLNSHDRKLQASRCMDCGVPFCHWACPLGNKDPEFQDALYRGKWREAYQILNSTNDFPEFTGRICPALCEKSCVLKLSCNEPVTIRENEAAIAEAAFREGYITPLQPERNGKKVAVIGAGPAGLSVAVRLNAKGYEVTLFDSKPMPGGLLRYGIPNFKLDKAPTDENILINLNDFVAMARVKVNGQDAGGVWTAPYELDITDFVKEGDNELEIEVVNTWVNRLIGDQKLPEAQRTTWTPCSPWTADSPLQKAGLMGPVVIESVTYEK